MTFLLQMFQSFVIAPPLKAKLLPTTFEVLYSSMYPLISSVQYSFLHHPQSCTHSGLLNFFEPAKYFPASVPLHMLECSSPTPPMV